MTLIFQMTNLKITIRPPIHGTLLKANQRDLVLLIHLALSVAAQAATKAALLTLLGKSRLVLRYS